ncbi:uncharacterized protein LOC110181617 [Drosophila serrata]|uniref:uncharacterized protein LOC110181617 n=1 Tax=Drosophila serrata TaxID=7274 RepID=UPI000A1D29B9|nr:uncharacterized protein LOC110181617 [Drosophila serrata]
MHQQQQPPLKLTVVTRQEHRPASEASVCFRSRHWATSAAQVAIRMEVSSNNNTNRNTLKLNTRTALAFLENGSSPTGISTVNLSPATTERDSEGRPLRRGYVPVEQKIQQEVQDLKSRGAELKRLRKINRQNTLKASLDKLQLSTVDEANADDVEVEHCYGHGKLRNAQSTQELDINGNEPEIVHKTAGNRSLNAAAYIANGASNGSINGMRPAMSLAQLCDMTPKEAPSSRDFIAQWESLIKKIIDELSNTLAGL